MKKLLIASSFVVLGIVSACGSSEEPVEETTEEVVHTEYYVYIDDAYDTYENGRYIYNNDGFNEAGEGQPVTFDTDEPVGQNLFVKVDTADGSYTIIDADDVPEKAKQELEENTSD